MVAGIGIDDAAASGRHAIKAALVDGLQERQNGARSPHLLRVNQLLATPELPRRDVILYADHHHWNNRPWLRNACCLGDHSDLHDLRLDLSKPRGKRLSSRTVRNENAGRPYHG